MTVRKNWSREQLIIAFSLYCQMPFGKMHSKNPEIIRYSKLIDRTPSALAMKLSNIASLDPAITSTGRKGLQSASLLDRTMWAEIINNWEAFTTEAEQVMASINTLDKNNGNVSENIEAASYIGQNKTIQTTARVGQNFFRKSVLSAYNNKCCISGLSVPKLLIASHIIPWSKDQSNRLNPQNGLALSMLHDKAFDLGLITIDENMAVCVSKNIDVSNDHYFDESIRSYNGKSISLPEKFQPNSEFLEFHRENIFESWL